MSNAPPPSSQAAHLENDVDEFPRLRVFAYTVESHAPLYRAIMRVFADGKAHFRIHYRPDQVAAELERLGSRPPLVEGGLERALDQLRDWGNLRRIHATGRVATLDDFRRRHFLYQITPAGEAAERAVGMVIDVLRESGSLQTVMLGAIAKNLAVLAAELERQAPRPEVVYEALFNVTQQFHALTENAGIFLGRLHEAIDGGDVRRQAFLVYKEAVIAYLDDFMRELSEVAPRITRTLGGFAEAEVERLVALAIEADPAPALDGPRDVAGRLRRQWHDVCAWFLGQPGQPPTLKMLRGAARSAIRRILMVLDQIHQKRFRRASRAADLGRLATWFEDQEQTGDAHALFQDAFGLYSARHLGAVGEHAPLLQPAESWASAAPVELAPALRESGRRTVAGRAPRIVDHAAARRRLREQHQQRQRRRQHALACFAGRGRQRLGELPVLSDDQLDLMLELLDRLLSRPAEGDGTRRARSRDGRLALVLSEPTERQLTEVKTVRGRLSIPDYTLTVVEGARPRHERPELDGAGTTGPGTTGPGTTGPSTTGPGTTGPGTTGPGTTGPGMTQ